MNRALKNKRGFTLMEMLIVVAVIAILVAVAIPVYNAQMHKARVATDWANLRAYYAEIQADYLTTGEYNAKVPDIHPVGGNAPYQTDYENITFLNGDKVKLQAGTYLVTRSSNQNGYEVTYQCNKYEEKHDLTLRNN